MTDAVESMSADVRAKTIQALLKTGSIAAAAREVKRNERTIRRWLEDATFLGELRSAMRTSCSAGNAVLAGNYGEAAEQLIALMKDPDATSARVSAAKAVLDQVRAAIELDDLAARIAALEERAGGAK